MIIILLNKWISSDLKCIPNELLFHNQFFICLLTPEYLNRKELGMTVQSQAFRAVVFGPGSPLYLPSEGCRADP